MWLHPKRWLQVISAHGGGVHAPPLTKRLRKKNPASSRLWNQTQVVKNNFFPRLSCIWKCTNVQIKLKKKKGAISWQSDHSGGSRAWRDKTCTFCGQFSWYWSCFGGVCKQHNNNNNNKINRAWMSPHPTIYMKFNIQIISIFNIKARIQNRKTRQQKSARTDAQRSGIYDLITAGEVQH